MTKNKKEREETREFISFPRLSFPFHIRKTFSRTPLKREELSSYFYFLLIKRKKTYEMVFDETSLLVVIIPMKYWGDTLE